MHRIWPALWLTLSLAAAERAGLHHVQIHGRFVTPDGAPVAGVRVSIGGRNSRGLPVANTRSAAGGRFVFPDLNTTNASDVLRWDSNDQWLGGALPPFRDSASTVDVGDIRLTANTVLRAVLRMADGTPVKPADFRVALESKGQPRHRLWADLEGDVFVLRDFSFPEGTIEVHPTFGVSYKGTYKVRQGRRDQMLLLTLHSDGTHGRAVEVSEITAPPAAPFRTRVAQGHVVDPEGAPIPGAIVHLGGGVDGTAHFVSTDAAGAFSLSYTDARCSSPSVMIANYDRNEFAAEGAPKSSSPELCDEFWKSLRTIRLQKARKFTIRLNGQPVQAPWVAHWWHEVLGWQAYSSLTPWAPKNFGSDAYLLEAPGRMPLVRRRPQNAPPELDFVDGEATRTLVVSAGGRPLSNAWVDVEWVEDLAAEARILLRSYRTGPDGSLTLRGAPDQLVEAFVSAEGYVPARWIWRAGAPLTIALAARNASVRFPLLTRGERVFARPAGDGESRNVMADGRTIPELKLAAGTYDFTRLDAIGRTVGYERVTLSAGARRDAHPESANFPRLTVRHPADWRVTALTGVSGSMPAGFGAFSFRGGFAPAPTPAPVLAAVTETETTFLLPYPGQFQLEASRKELPGYLWREVTVAARAAATIVLPDATATLAGVMLPIPETSHHGVATPRFQLIAHDPEGWSATIPLPSRGKDGDFKIPSLPAGDYAVQHHLNFSGKAGEFRYPIPAWGGTPVRLEAGRVTTMKPLVEIPFADLPVEVEGADVVTVRVVDRMASAWGVTASGPTTLSYADFAIPAPPAVRTRGGKATLPSIREGLLELVVEFDDGRRVPLRATAKHGETLRLRLPAAEAGR